MQKYPPFIKGLELNRGFFFDAVKPLIEENYPGLSYSASLLGYGSDVLGFDTEISMDHNWGPRLQIFTEDEKFKNEIDNCLKQKLPFEYRNFPVNFSAPAYDKVQSMEYTESKPVNHLIEINTVKKYFHGRYSMEKTNDFGNDDWLAFTDQNLLEITSGLVFYDGLNILNKMRKELEFYPPDIWKLRLAVLWNYIWNKEAFIGRSIAVNDYAGLKLNTARIVGYLIKILFYIEKKYIPYSKWFGTAFRELKIFNNANEIVVNVLNENEPKKIEANLCLLYEFAVAENNKSNELPHIKNRTRDYFNRPYRVIFAENIVEELVESIVDCKVKKINLKQYAHDIILDL